MNLWQRFLAFVRGLFDVHDVPQPAPLTRPLLGLNVHEATPADLARLASIPRASQLGFPIRTTDYGDADSYARLVALRPMGFPCLVVLSLRAQHPYVTANTALQLGNEPDTNGLSAAQFGAAFRANRQAFRQTLSPVVRIIAGAFSNEASVEYMTTALLAGAADGDAVAFHVYGDDLVMAYQNRLIAVRAAMQAAACTKPLWVTEIGFPSLDPGEQKLQWMNLFAALPELQQIAKVDAVFAYALATDEKGDFHGLCKHDDVRTPLPAWPAVGAMIQLDVRRPAL